MQYLGNAFSLQMLNNFNTTIEVREIDEKEFNIIKDSAKSVIGHQDTANLLGVQFNRQSITLEKGDIIYIAQLMGGRLPEGATTLPSGFEFKFLEIKVGD